MPYEYELAYQWGVIGAPQEHEIAVVLSKPGEDAPRLVWGLSPEEALLVAQELLAWVKPIMLGVAEPELALGR
jgi:hypothetical protein